MDARSGTSPAGHPVLFGAVQEYGLPPAFLVRMQRLLADEYDEFVSSYSFPPTQGMRANTLKVSPEHLRELVPFGLEPLPGLPEGFSVENPQGGDVAPGKHPYHSAGLYYLQDPSAMTVARLLDPQPGERVLDLSAAPGGKSTHIAALMQGEGLLVANETHPQRSWELAGNLERCGVRHAAITNEPPRRLADAFPAFFDRVLVDAPCSGEGMFRKSVAARTEWHPGLVRGCAARQDDILRAAADMVRPGGVLVYSTCTFSPEENEGSVVRLLENRSDFSLVEAPHAPPGGRPGRSDWVPQSARSGEVTRAIRLWPHLAQGEGHFMAMLRREDDGVPRAQGRPPSAQPNGPAGAGSKRGERHRSAIRSIRSPNPLTAQMAQLLEHFLAENLTAHFDLDRLMRVGTYVYQEPSPSLGSSTPRYVHPGWWLGVLHRDRFDPSHALALGLPLGAFERSVSLAPDDPALSAYLRGESFSSSFIPMDPSSFDGWLIVAVDGFPLGWGRLTGGVIKNHYPKGLRATSRRRAMGGREF